LTVKPPIVGLALPVVVSLASLVGAERTTAVQAPTSLETWVLTEPKRRAADAALAPPPPLPADAETISPATLDIIVRPRADAERRSQVRETISRTVDRIHLKGHDGREWLFERNPLDPRRVSATVIQHAAKTLVLYEETDLRIMLGIRGWADVLALGFDRQSVSIERTRPSVDLALLRPPVERFPGYRVVDLAEWLEK
jgi:hypothetical protein